MACRLHGSVEEKNAPLCRNIIRGADGALRGGREPRTFSLVKALPLTGI
jgi:hypothetical protein